MADNENTSVTKDLGIVSAYGYAKAAGYTGTEEEFEEIFLEFTEDAPGLLDRLDEAVSDCEDAASDAADAKTAAENAQTAAEAAAATFTTDTTLSVSGKAADAKVTGDEVSALKTALTQLDDAAKPDPKPIGEVLKFNQSGALKYTDGSVAASTAYQNTDYIDISGYQKIVYPRIKSAANPTTKPGIAFYNAEKTYISGVSGIYNADAGGIIYDETDVPQNAKYIRLSMYMSYLPRTYYLKDPSDLKIDIEKVTDSVLDTDKSKLIFHDFVLSATGAKTIIDYGTGSTTSVTSEGAFATDYYDISGISKIVYTRMVSQSSTSRAGLAFYDSGKTYISGQRGIINSDVSEYRLTTISVPTNAKYVRFSGNAGLGAFHAYDFAEYEKTLFYEVEQLKKYHPDYSGKKISILGDSISTFCLASEKVDDEGTMRAPEGCTTNYPNNAVKYEYSDVTTVHDTWWGKVIDNFGMVLGINESWAGSTIGYNSNYTNSGKYTADNCMCSETRIGHLDENGTPDIIFVFGGTNDINHHLSGSDTRFAVGSLDTTNNPYDFDNFPMVTDTYYGAITTMLLRIQHEYPTATILMLLPYFCTYTHTSSGDIASPSDQNIWCNAAIDVCKFLGVEYLDLRTIINMYDVSTLLFDNLHPNATGMAAIAKAVIHKLNSML